MSIRENLNGKKLKDLATKDTKHFGFNIEDIFPDRREEKLNEYLDIEITKRDFTKKSGDFLLIGDEGLFSLFENGTLKATINEYEGINPFLSAEKKICIVPGHDAISIVFLGDLTWKRFFIR